MKILRSDAPLITYKFNKNLLSTPVCGFKVENLLKILQWLEKRIISGKFRKHPHTVLKIREKIKQFMDIYEQAKEKEGLVGEKKSGRAKSIFYRPRLDNRCDQRIYERLNNRKIKSEFDRLNNAF